MEKRIAVFPGSFDPITKGHYEVIKKAAGLFDEIIVAMGTNTSKKYLFSDSKRFELLESSFRSMGNITPMRFDGLTIDFCRSQKARYILRGLRNGIDFEYERSIADMNKSMAPEIETVFLITDPDYSAISSSIVRELIKNKTDVAQFLPPAIGDKIYD